MTASRAAKIANDIAENIDCGESRKELRECIAYFATENSKKIQSAHLRRTDDLIKQMRKFQKQYQTA